MRWFGGIGGLVCSRDYQSIGRAGYQMFLAKLGETLGVPIPDPTSPDPERNLYLFDRAITRVNPGGATVTNYIEFIHDIKAKAREFETGKLVG